MVGVAEVHAETCDDDNKLPAHLSDMYNITVSGLHDTAEHRVTQLLREFQDISKHDLVIGCLTAKAQEIKTNLLASHIHMRRFILGLLFTRIVHSLGKNGHQTQRGSSWTITNFL
jgi:hypothetical protein